MSDLGFNKIAGAVLATGLAVVGLNVASEMLFEPHHLEECPNCPEVAEVGVEAEALPVDWGTVLPVANVAAGEQAFNRCTSCHKLDGNDQGPFLEGVMGRTPGGLATFGDYSDAIHEFGAENPQWTFDEVYHFLENPRRYLPGTKMTFAGLRDEQTRIDLIAYLNQWGSGLPIPEPLPVAEEGAEGEEGEAVEGEGAEEAPAEAEAEEVAALD